MASTNKTILQTKKWLHIAFGICLLITFFLPWVLWSDSSVKGYDLSAGNFFAISASQFGLENPFPGLSFSFYIFWLIPVLLVFSIFLAITNKKTTLPACIAGTLSLALIAIYFLFTKTLIDLGVGTNVYQMLQLPAYITIVTAIGFILTVLPDSLWYRKLIWLLLGPVLAFSAYKFGEKKIWNETHSSTDNVTADYSISANELLKEFLMSDSLSNAKYTEKIITVNGNISEIERTSDSTTNIRFTDSTGSYIVFSFKKDQYEQLKKIKPRDSISLKGSCSGSIYSEILGTTSISFKRSILNTNKN